MYLALFQGKFNVIVGRHGAKLLGYVPHLNGRHALFLDGAREVRRSPKVRRTCSIYPDHSVTAGGCCSLMSTRKSPSLICCSRSRTFASRSAGILLSVAWKGARLAPPLATILKSFRSWEV